MGENLQVDEFGREILKKGRYSGVRKIIGFNMATSLGKAPQATITTRVDVTAIKEIKDKFTAKGEKVTYTDLYIKAVGLALEKHPAVNSSVSLDGKNYTQFKTINVGCAIGVDNGLYVAVIKDVSNKTVLEISKELKTMAADIRSGEFDTAILNAGTFTVSNLGMYDIDIGTPIINTPEAAILCLGATRKEFVIQDDDTAVIRPMMTMSLTLDHAAMDGLEGAKFLATLKKIITSPDKQVFN